MLSYIKFVLVTLKTNAFGFDFEPLPSADASRLMKGEDGKLCLAQGCRPSCACRQGVGIISGISYQWHLAGVTGQ